MTDSIDWANATEAELREAKAPWPKTIEELDSFIGAMTDRKHDYGTCVYAISMTAVATLNYVASKLGGTGFQVSCADLDILKRTRGMTGPFGIVNAENMLYPQYDLRAKLEEWLAEWHGWAAKEAKKKLAESGDRAHPDVRARWNELAATCEA